MSNANDTLIRRLVPKSIHFDGYNEINCPNSRDKPFFSDNSYTLGNHTLSTILSKDDQYMLIMSFESVCPYDMITFSTYTLTLKEFVSKLKEAIQTGSDFITFPIQVHYNQEKDTKCYNIRKSQTNCPTRECTALAKKRNNPAKLYAAVSFDTPDVIKALNQYMGITPKYKGETTMKKTSKKILGMDFEFGMSKDSNIASTLMGVAVKNPESGNWYTFDPANNVRKNIASFRMGNFPIFLLPASMNQLVKGDLIKKDGKYYYLKNISASGLSLIGAADGVVIEMLPEENIIPGLNMYTKVVAFNTATLTDAASNQNMSGNLLAAMLMMQWSDGNKDEFSLDDIGEDSFNGMGAFLPILLASNGGMSGDGFFNGVSMNLPMLMALGSSSDGDSSSEAMQMLVISQLLSGNAASPLSSIFPGSVAAPATAATPAEGTTVVCKACGAQYPEGTNFCTKCGNPTSKPDVITCPKCNAVVKPDAAFCYKCGAKLTKDTCASCGAEIEEGAAFCSKCGAAVNEDKVEKSETAPTPPADK